MSDLISRSALLEKVQFRLPIDNHNAEVISGCVDITRRLIENAPAVDAVEVVRCRDCKFRKSTFNGEDYFCTVWDADDSETAYVTDDDFCSYGERRAADS